RKERPFSMYMAQELAGSDRDFLLHDLFKGVRDSISYFELGAQMIPEGEWREQESDIFNPTVLWKPSQFPVQPLGALTVEQSVKNHLSDTVKSCFRIDNLCSGLFLPDREIFREAAITMGELSRARVHIPYGFDENKFSPAPMEEHSKSPLDLIKERISDMSERESRRLAENISESLKSLDGDTLEKTLLLITDLNFSFGRALMNMLEA
ncbi:MAG: catalase, partial [Oscillospiraceae bacterium]